MVATNWVSCLQNTYLAVFEHQKIKIIIIMLNYASYHSSLTSYVAVTRRAQDSLSAAIASLPQKSIWYQFELIKSIVNRALDYLDAHFSPLEQESQQLQRFNLHYLTTPTLTVEILHSKDQLLQQMTALVESMGVSSRQLAVMPRHLMFWPKTRPPPSTASTLYRSNCSPKST